MLPFKVIFLIFKFPCVEGSPERYNSFLREKKKRQLIPYCPLAGEKDRNVVLKKKKKMQGWLRHIDKHTHD